METSLQVPTATSVRAVPAKLLIDNRIVINNHLARSRGGKVSFTHLIGYAIVKALASMPEMNNGFAESTASRRSWSPPTSTSASRSTSPSRTAAAALLVPSIKGAETMDFAQFWTAYEDVVRRARANKLTVDDFAGTTISLTNPGTIGTVHSVPRLMQGQGTIIGVGALEYPAEWQGASQETLNRNAVSKILTLTSTYDHRIIQGAQSGDFLRVIHQLLLGEDGFYDEIFRVAADPVRADPLDPGHLREPRRRHQQDRAGAGADPRLPRARPPDGRHRPAGVPPAPPPRPRRHHPRPDPVGPRPRVRHRRLRRHPDAEAAQHPRRPARLVLPHRRHRVHAHPGPRAAQLDPGQARAALRQDVTGGAAAHPAPAQRRRGVRDLPADQVRRPEAVQPRGRRVGHRAARPDPVPRRGRGPRRGLHRHAAPWPPQRAGQHRRQVLRPDLPRVRGQAGPEVASRAPAT